MKTLVSKKTIESITSGNQSLARQVAPVVVLLVAIGAITIMEPSFLQSRSLGTVVKVAAPLIFLALGQTFTIMTGGIDLSIAVVASLGSVLVAQLVPTLGFTAIIVVLLVTTLIGLINGAVAAIAQVPTFIVTLGGMSVWGAVAMVLSGATTIPVTERYESIGWLTRNVVGVIPLVSILAILFCVLAALLIKYLKRGRVFHMIGLGEGAALLAGIRTKRVRIGAFALAGFFAGCAGVAMTASQFSGSPTLANELLLPLIAAVIIGGTAITGGVGGPIRSLIGALTIAVLRVGLGIAGVDAAIEQIIYGSAIIIAILFTIDRSKISVVK